MLKDNDMRAVLINELNRINTHDYRIILVVFGIVRNI